MKKFLMRFLWSGLLGIMTSFAIGFAGKYLPDLYFKDWLLDKLVLPGAFLLIPIFPQGPDTGKGVPFWGYYVMATNCFIYMLCWFFLLTIFAALIKYGKNPSHAQ